MLTPVQINAAILKAKRDQKSTILKVDSGLFLRISPKGTALWCAKTKLAGKTYNCSLGHYPEITAATARVEKNLWIKDIRADDVNAGEDYTFAQAYHDWAERKRHTVKDFDTLDRSMKLHILDILGHRKLKDLTAFTFIKALAPLEDQEHFAMLKRLTSIVRQIAVFVQNTGRVDEIHDLTHISQNYVRTKPARHQPAVAPDKLSDVFYTLEGNHCRHGMLWAALLTLIYTLSRTKEVCLMKWDWIDFDNKVIHFPAEIMKMKLPHDVPLSTQLKKLLQSIPRKNDFVFVSEHITADGKPINPRSLNGALADYGLRGIQSAHGFRSVGASWMAENDIPMEVAEACLAHASGSAVRRAYQRSELLEKRRPVMQAWCDYVEQCREKALEKILEKAKSEL